MLDDTQKTIKPGVYFDISNEDYHNGPGISKSGLDKISRSALHYKSAQEEEREETASMRLGTMFHTLVLEPDEFWNRYARPFVAPEDAVSGNDQMKAMLKELGEKTGGNKADLIERLRAADPAVIFLDDAKTEYEEANEGKEVISEKEYETVCGMRDSLMSNPLAKSFFAPGNFVPEVSFYWIDPETGILCRCRVDAYAKNGMIGDLKSCVDAREEFFFRSVEKYRYNVQDAFYSDGISLAKKQSEEEIDLPEPKEFIFFSVESSKPYASNVFILDNEEFDQSDEIDVMSSEECGRWEYRQDLKRYADALAKNEWKGYGENVKRISISEYKRRRLTEQRRAAS